MKTFDVIIRDTLKDNRISISIFNFDDKDSMLIFMQGFDFANESKTLHILDYGKNIEKKYI